MIRDVHLRRGRVSLLDVGGGFGVSFFELLRVIDRGALANLSYDILDNEPNCLLGRCIFADYEVKPTFASDLHSLREHYDIVVLVGTLQYLPDWKKDVANFSDLAGIHFYIARTPIAAAGFSTVQFICPAYGTHAKRNLGSTRINVVGVADLRHIMSSRSWHTSFEFMDADYSSQFARLPQPQRDASYYTMGWRRAAQT